MVRTTGVVPTPRPGRAELIEHKAEVQAEIERLRRQVETLGQRQGAGPERSRLAELQRELEARMAEEVRLRQLIDRSK